MLLNKFKEFLLVDNGLSNNTVDSYITAIKLLLNRYDAVTKENIKKYIDEQISDGLSVKTLNLRINAFNKFFKFSGIDFKMKTAKVERRLSLENIPTEKHYNILLQYLIEKNIEHYYWIRVLAGTGARVSEFTQFTWEDIASGCFMLRGKGNKYRYFYIQKELSREIAQYAKINKKAGIFPENRFGKKMLTRGIAYHMDKWNKDLGFPKGMLHPHAFRHFFAKQYLKNSKKDIVQLAEFLGHESLDTTRVYLLKSREEQMKDFNKYVNW